MNNYLKLSFRTDTNQTYDLKINNVNPNIEEIIASIIDEIIASNAIEEKNGKITDIEEAILYEESVIEVSLT